MNRAFAGALAIAVAMVGQLAVGPASASAGTLSRDGSNVVVFTASPGETNNIDVFQAGAAAYYINDANQNFTDNGSGCQDFHAYGYWYCASVAGYRLALGDGNDQVVPNQYYPNCGCTAPPDVPVEVLGGTGNDTLVGGSANDVLDGGTGADSINGSGGTDTVTYAGRSENVFVTLDGTANDGGASDGSSDNVTGVEHVVGGNGNDTLSAAGTTGPTTLEGGLGSDSLTAGNGAAHLIGGEGNDQLFGAGANDVLDGGPGNDSLVPLAGSDNVLAGAGVDSINTQDGQYDTIDCGGNHDNVTADAGDPISNCTDPPLPTSDPALPTSDPPLPTSGGGGGNDSTSTASPTKLASKLAFAFKATPKATTFQKLVVSKIALGATLVAKCRTKKGKKCAHTRDFKKSKAPSSLRLRGFEKKALPVGAKLTITETKPGTVKSVKILTIRKSKKPSLTTR